MQILFSFLYAPLIVILLSYFEIKPVAIGLFCFGVIWLLSLKEKVLKTVIFPAFYIGVAAMAFWLDDFIVFKFLPLLISLSFLMLLISSYFDNASIILHFAHKLHKNPIDEKEETYIQHSTLWWMGISCVNIFAHIAVLLLKNDEYWVVYSSFGWYFVFAIGGIVHFLHRKFIFLKRA